MIETNPFWIIILVLYIAFFAVFFLMVNIHSLVAKKFSILNYFPYEVMNQKSPLILISRIALFAFVIPSQLPIVLVLMNEHSFGSFLYFEAVLGGVLFFVSLINVIITFIPVEHTKAHNIVATIEMAFAFLLSALVSFNGFYFSYLYQSQSTGSVYHLMLGIIATVLAIFSLIIIFNPKLKDWYKMNATTSEDGTLSIERPKLFVLAFSEWLTILISFLSGLIFIFELVKM